MAQGAKKLSRAVCSSSNLVSPSFIKSENGKPGAHFFRTPSPHDNFIQMSRSFFAIGGGTLQKYSRTRFCPFKPRRDFISWFMGDSRLLALPSVGKALKGLKWHPRSVWYFGKKKIKVWDCRSKFTSFIEGETSDFSSPAKTNLERKAGGQKLPRKWLIFLATPNLGKHRGNLRKSLSDWLISQRKSSSSWCYLPTNTGKALNVEVVRKCLNFVG